MRRSFRCLDKPREVRDRSLALFDCRRLDEPDNDALSMREVVTTWWQSLAGVNK